MTEVQWQALGMAVLLLTVGLVIWRQRGMVSARAVLAMTAVYGLGVVSAGLIDLTAGRPRPLACRLGRGGLAAVAVIAFAIVRQRQPSRRG